jgi:GDPmannose 4,6-dehydratase
MKAIIFGANGQDGFYLTQLLVQQNIKVIGVSRSGNFLHTDITNYTAVSNLIQEHQPEYIFHLAANSTTRHDAMFENHQTICTGTLNILEAVKNYATHSKVFISGSGLQFVNNNQPIKETDAFDARDAYSVSRIQSVYAARYFKKAFGIKTYVGYFFNHDSPRRSERHMAQKIAAAAVRISKGIDEQLQIGDITTVKEWTFAGDIVKGIWCLVNQNIVDEAIIGSGIGYSIEDWLHECFTLVNKNWKEHVVLVDGFTAEYKQLVSNSTLIHSLGWQPQTSFKDLAKMMMQHD